MKDYRVEFLPEAPDELASFDKAVAQRILKKLKWLFKLRIGRGVLFVRSRETHYHRPSYRTLQGDLQAIMKNHKAVDITRRS